MERNNVVNTDGSIDWDKIGSFDTQLAETALIVSGLKIDEDNTSTIQNAYNTLNSGQRLLIPSGTWLADGLIFDKDDIEIICLGTLKPLLPTTDFVIMFGTNITGQFRRSAKGNIKVDSGSDWHTYTGRGVIFKNISQCKMTISVNGMDVGVELLGDGSGVAYNHFDVITLTDCKRMVYTRAINGGWANENSFYGGRFATFSGKVNYDDVVYLDIGENDLHPSDGIKFFNNSFEGTGKLLKFRGNAHIVKYARMEMSEGSKQFKDLIDLTEATKCEISTVYDNLNALFKYDIVENITRFSLGKIKIFNIAVDYTQKFYINAEVVVNYTDLTYTNAIVANKYYNATDGTIVTLNTDVDPVKTISSITVNTVRNINLSNTISPNRYKTFGGNNNVEKNNIMELLGNSIMPNLVAHSPIASNKFFEVSLSGNKKASLDYEGNLSITKLQLGGEGLSLYQTSLTPPSGVFNIGDVCITSSASSTWLFFQYQASGWVPIGQKRINKSVSTNRPTLSLNEIGAIYFDTTLGGKPIWWDGGKWVDATGTTV